MSTASSPAIPVMLVAGDSNHLDGVMEVMSDAFSGGFGEGWSRSQCAGILPLSGVLLTLACDEAGHTRGFSLQRTVADESELLLLAVHRSVQRCGIGLRLIERFIDDSRSNGASRLHLEVRDGNPAMAMYRSFGFSPAGRRINYYRGSDAQTYDAVTMVLDLNRA